MRLDAIRKRELAAEESEEDQAPSPSRLTVGSNS